MNYLQLFNVLLPANRSHYLDYVSRWGKKINHKTTRCWQEVPKIVGLHSSWFVWSQSSLLSHRNFQMYIVPFPVAAPDYFCWGGVVGWGWGGKNVKGQKWLIFPIFVLVKGACGGKASDQGRAKCPMSPLPFFFSRETPNTRPTWFELIGNCMHGYEMIIVDS